MRDEITLPMLRETLSRFPAKTLLRPPEPASASDGIWSVRKPSLLSLHVQGKPEALGLLDRLRHRGLGVVGTREPQHRSRTLVRQVIGELRGRDLVVVSGFAKGIDAAAHEAALENGMPTVAILGCGLEVDYPRGHAELRLRILEAGGLIVSEFESGTEPYAGHFHRRNRLIAGWSAATWVVQAGFRSGALNTASWAARHDRIVYATPGFPGDPALAGNQRLIQHLSAETLHDSRDLASTWPELRGGPSARARPAPGASAGYSRRRDSRSKELARRVGALAKAQGGAQVEQLLDWAIQEQGWLPVEFFDALSTALDERWIQDLNGVLLAGVPAQGAASRVLPPPL